MAARTGNAMKAAVLGHPVKHSLSPALHEFWLREYEIDGAYIPLDVSPEALQNTLPMLHDLGFTGVNLTIPHKQQGFLLSDNRDERSERISASNTLIFTESGISAFNTDAYGFMMNLKHAGCEVNAATQAVVIGAGGAARGVIVALLEEEVKHITIINRTAENAIRLRDEICATCILPKSSITVLSFDQSEEALLSATLLINTTSLGMAGEPPLKLPIHALQPHAFVTDVVYTPLRTPLLQQAEAQGLKTVDGLGMLIHQAVPAFEMFFGVPPVPSASLRQHLESLLA